MCGVVYGVGSDIGILAWRECRAGSRAASARDDASSVAPSLEQAEPKDGGGGDVFDIFASIAPPRRGRSVPQALSNPFDVLSGGASARSVASSISDVTGSYVSASRLAPSGQDVRGVRHGAADSHEGSSAGNVSGEPRRDHSGMPICDPDGNGMEAQFKPPSRSTRALCLRRWCVR